MFVLLLAHVELWVYATSNAVKSTFHPNTVSGLMGGEVIRINEAKDSP
jgi:hypothetical protein